MVDHFSDITYVHLMISKSQEKALSENTFLKDRQPYLELKFVHIIQAMVDLLNIVSDKQFRVPTRQYNFVGLDNIIKTPLLKENFKLSN